MNEQRRIPRNSVNPLTAPTMEMRGVNANRPYDPDATVEFRRLTKDDVTAVIPALRGVRSNLTSWAEIPNRFSRPSSADEDTIVLLLNDIFPGREIVRVSPTVTEETPRDPGPPTEEDRLIFVGLLGIAESRHRRETSQDDSTVSRDQKLKDSVDITPEEGMHMIGLKLDQFEIREEIIIATIRLLAYNPNLIRGFYNIVTSTNSEADLKRRLEAYSAREQEQH